MKIDYLRHRFLKNHSKNSQNSNIEVSLLLKRLSLNLPVWTNENINDNQMDDKPSGEAISVPEETKQPEESQLTSPKTKTPELEENAASIILTNENKSQEIETQKEEDILSLEPELPQSEPQLDHQPRIIVKHSILGNKIPSHDPNVLIESATFTSIGKIQPFLITVSTNAALIMDYHSHLTTSEVVGYLAGSWDVNSHNLTVTHAFPCKCRLGDYESSPAMEVEIRKAIKSSGLTVVGWYHSHPTAPTSPSIRDVEMQLDFQLRMKGANDSTYLPCVGFICSPYNLENPSLESTIVSYWVIPPPENKIHEYGKPMMMSYTVVQDQSISQDVLMEMKKCADFYKTEKDYIKFSETISGSVTFLEKLKMSLIPKFPLNHQKSETLWTFIKDLVDVKSEKTETEILKELMEISNIPSATPPPEKPKFNMPNIPPSHSPLSFKNTPSSNPTAIQYQKSQSRSKSSGKRSSRDGKNLASLSNYFVGSDLAALFGSGKFPGMGLDPATKSLLNLNSLSLGSMFLPPMAAAAAAAASYKPDPNVGLMKPPPPPSPYYSYSSSRSPSNSRNNSSGSSSRSLSRSIPSTSRDMPPPKVPKIDVHQMANFFIPSNLGKNCTITANRPSGSSNK